jgi:hypothetical protein
VNHRFKVMMLVMAVVDEDELVETSKLEEEKNKTWLI